MNLLGGIAEVKGNRLEAEEYYRAALTRDPGYEPAKLNLERLAGRPYTQRRHCLGSDLTEKSHKLRQIIFMILFWAQNGGVRKWEFLNRRIA